MRPIVLAIHALTVALLLGAALPAAAIPATYRLTGDATLLPEGESDAAPLTGSFELVRGPLCALPPGEPPQCAEPPQWTPRAFDLAGGGFSVLSAEVEPIAIIDLVFGGRILLDPVGGLERLTVILSREFLSEDAESQVFRELRLVPVDGPVSIFDYDPSGVDIYPATLSLGYELVERVGTITFPPAGVIAVAELTSETITPLAGIQLAAELPEPGGVALLGVAAAAAATRRRRR